MHGIINQLCILVKMIQMIQGPQIRITYYRPTLAIFARFSPWDNNLQFVTA